MYSKLLASVTSGMMAIVLTTGAAARAQGLPAAEADDPVRTLVGRLDLEKYKTTIKGLTAFGDRRQGTDRNRAAIDWIEAQLKSYGCTNTERIKYDYQPPAGRGGAAGAGRGEGAGAAGQAGEGRGAGRGEAAAAGRGGGRGRAGQGGSTIFGNRARPGVNNDPTAQPDVKLRDLNSQPSAPGLREQVFCTKIGTTRPDEMYIVGGHMDGIGFGEAANDDGSGTALVMELARVFGSPDVQTERSIRFALWNNEESGLNGARAYVDQRKDLQGKEDPAGSRRYPEPKWLGVIQHDMMMFDHGMPGPDGKVSPEQRPEADVNIEFQSTAKMAEGAQKLAWFFKAANEKYATDYPAAVGPHMTNTDSTPFMDLVPAISLRENERGAQIGGGWDPHWHQVTDVFSTFSDKDFRLGLNATQTTLSAVAQLTGATVKK
jgi:Peptidase family M28